MRVLIRKMSKIGLLKVEMIVGSLIMAVAMLGLPIGLASVDASLLANPTVLGFVVIVMLGFGLVGFFCFIRPYLLYRKYPAVQVEADDEFLYIHTKKEAKIPLSMLAEATVRVELPYLYQKEFLREFLLHLFSEEYGDVILEVPNYGSYKMRFVAKAKAAANELVHFIFAEINKD